MEKTAGRMDTRFGERPAAANPDRAPGWYSYADLNTETNVLTRIEERVAKKPAPESADTFVLARVECEYAPNSANVLAHKREYWFDPDGSIVSETVTDYWPYAVGNNPLRATETGPATADERPHRRIAYFHPDWTSVVVAQQAECPDSDSQTNGILPVEILHPKGYRKLQEYLEQLDSKSDRPSCPL